MNTQTAKEIIQYYKDGGSFENALLKTVQFADKKNLNNLYYAYPALVEAHCIVIGIDYTATSGAGIYFNKNNDGVNYLESLNKAIDLL